MGHAEPAAGMVGLHKLSIVMAMTGSIVPNAQLRVVNPHVLAVKALSVRGHFSTQCGWMTSRSNSVCSARLGGVSSFGYSGTIAHSVLRAPLGSFGNTAGLFESR
eukprot:2183845-Pleurochrysis_carterae.AAC.1